MVDYVVTQEGYDVIRLGYDVLERTVFAYFYRKEIDLNVTQEGYDEMLQDVYI